MGKRGKNQTRGDKNPKRKLRGKGDVVEEVMDDEIDAFHKQRDLVPLDVNGGTDESDEDDEVPVFDFEDGDDGEGESDEDEDDIPDTGDAKKIVRQIKYMREKFGGVEDATVDDDEEEEEEHRTVWGGRKDLYYRADNIDIEQQSSDDVSPAEEEEEAINLQREKAKSMSTKDFGLEDTSEEESDRELTLEEMSVKGKSTRKSSFGKEVADDKGTAYEEVKKDLNALSREELMDVLYSSAPELVGLLSELNDAIEQLESKVDPLLNKVKNGEIILEGGIRYLELKKLLLLSYCQSIAFYLLLKSEGQPVRDHPVLAHLVEIKSLLDKTKELDGNLPAELGEILKKSNLVKAVVKLGKENATSAPDSFMKDQEPSHVSTEIQAAAENNGDLVKVELLKENEKRTEKRKRQDDQVAVESMKMFKVRAALEEKLKQKGVFSSIAPKVDKDQKLRKPLNRQLETYDDFDDDTANVEAPSRGLINGNASSRSSRKLSQLVAANPNKPKVVSGDDDIPKRDNVGERRRKHELQVLARAGIIPEDDAGDEVDRDVDSDEDVEMDEDSGSEGSEDEFYRQVKQQRAEKLAAKAEIYSRNSAAVAALPETANGKRQITYQMVKNRGLTRQRKKLTKNPRKKYKLKHQKSLVRRKGQVREIKKPMVPYGGETSGINAGISRSIRFRS
ncbi:Something about silencing protein 10 [Morus notabilis]|uniref:Something about silencing protein 10 n=2 Tax=Morus notabilis TaxID=981085 RepID=W9R3E2_9ROSA|nr:Something about silencing protein 10 [Morus notabilis]